MGIDFSLVKALKETSAKVPAAKKSRQGRPIVARRFIAGYPVKKLARPSGTVENHLREIVQASLQDTAFPDRIPGNELPGYFRSFLRNDAEHGLLQRSLSGLALRENTPGALPRAGIRSPRWG